MEEVSSANKGAKESPRQVEPWDIGNAEIEGSTAVLILSYRNSHWAPIKKKKTMRKIGENLARLSYLGTRLQRGTKG